MFLNNKKLLQKYFDLSYHFALRDFKSKYAGTKLGLIWAIIKPVLQASIVGTIFSNLYQDNSISMYLYILIGFICWNTFSSATISAPNIFLSERMIINKAAFPLITLIMGKTASKFFDFTISIFTLFVCIKIIYFSFSYSYLISSLISLFFLMGLTVAFYLFTLLFVIIISITTIIYKDLRHLVDTFIRLLFFVTPVFYQTASLSTVATYLVQINPIYYPLSIFRLVLIETIEPITPSSSLISFIIMINIIFFSGYLFKKHINTVVEKV